MRSLIKLLPVREPSHSLFSLIRPVDQSIPPMSIPKSRLDRDTRVDGGFLRVPLHDAKNIYVV